MKRLLILCVAMALFGGASYAIPASLAVAVSGDWTYAKTLSVLGKPDVGQRLDSLTYTVTGSAGGVVQVTYSFDPDSGELAQEGWVYHGTNRTWAAHMDDWNAHFGPNAVNRDENGQLIFSWRDSRGRLIALKTIDNENGDVTGWFVLVFFKG